MKLNTIIPTIKQIDFKKNPDYSLDSEEKIFEKLFEIQTPPSEEEQKKKVKLLRQQGFQISSRNDIDAYTLLESEIFLLKESELLSAKNWYEYYEVFINTLIEKRKCLDEQVNKLNEKELKYDKDIAEYKEKKQKLKTELEELKKKLITVRETLSTSKRGIGEKLITDAEIELKKVVGLQKTIYYEVKAINEDRFKNTKYALDELIRKWKELRSTYVERFQIVNNKLKQLGGDGINLTVARTLIGLGSATAGVAGYFFAIFSSKSGYSSDDVFYYLLKNIIDATINPNFSIFVKFGYLIGALLIITGASWLADKLIKKTNYYQKEKERKEHYQNFATNFKIDGLSYSFKTQEKSWLFLWLKIVPLLLIIGIVILLLSYGANIKGATDNLSASTEGLLIGTAIAMGLSAVIYIYITKVTEARIQTPDSTGIIKHNWELVIAIALFILSIVVFAFYKSADEAHQSSAGTYSIIGFIGSCLLAAFTFAYGLRFLGLLLLADEIKDKIDLIDEYIALNSVPGQPVLNLKINEYFTELSQGLLNQLNKKNEAVLNTDDEQRITYSSNGSSDESKNNVINFFIPKAKKKNLEDSNLFEIMEWELEYFPEYAEQLKILASLYREKKNELEEVEAELKNCISEKESKVQLAKAERQKIDSKKDRLQALIMKAQKGRIDRDSDSKEKIETSITYLKDGFDLGLWYRQHGMGPRHYQLLLKEKN